MGNIYASASLVLVWLGEDSDIQYYLRWVSLHLNFGDQSQSQNEHQTKYQSGRNIEALVAETESSDRLVHGYDTLNAHSYWTRLWVVPEMYHAQEATFLCGKESLSVMWQVNMWVLLYLDACTAALRHMAESGPMIDTIQHKLSDKSSQQPRMTPRMIQLLSSFGSRNCTDPRDKIFALLSVSSDGYDFPVNYEMTVEELFFNVYTRFCLSAEISGKETLMSALGLNTSSLLDHFSQIENGGDAHLKFTTRLLQPGALSECYCGSGPLKLPSEYRTPRTGIWCLDGINPLRISPVTHVLLERIQNSCDTRDLSPDNWSVLGLVVSNGPIVRLASPDTAHSSSANKSSPWRSIRIQSLDHYPVREQDCPWEARSYRTKVSKGIDDQSGGSLWMAEYSITKFSLALLFHEIAVCEAKGVRSVGSRSVKMDGKT